MTEPARVVGEFDAADGARFEPRYAWRRPRSAHDVAVAAEAFHRRTVNDGRYRCFCIGANLALGWVLAVHEASPLRGVVSAVPGSEPGFPEIVGEYLVAVQVAGGTLEVPAQGPVLGMGWCDGTRLIARGVEAFLLWYAFSRVPTYGLLDPDASLREVFAPLGDVGTGPDGLDGPGISGIRFPLLPGSLASIDADGGLVAVTG